MNEIIPAAQPERAVVVASPSPMQMLSAALDRGIDPEKLKSLMDLAERYEANEARKAYVAAITAFKANAPKIYKDKQVRFQTTKGITEYKHALSGAASEEIGAALAEHDISHRWKVEHLDGGKIKVTCVLTHALGHSEEAYLQAAPDDSGGKNSIQAVGSTVSYLQRYSLFAASGIVPQDADDDGRQGVQGLSESVKADFLASVDAVNDAAGWDKLWHEITEATTEAGDVASHEELRAAMAKKRKELKS